VTQALAFDIPDQCGASRLPALSGPRCISVGKKLANQSPTSQKPSACRRSYTTVSEVVKN